VKVSGIVDKKLLESFEVLTLRFISLLTAAYNIQTMNMRFTGLIAEQSDKFLQMCESIIDDNFAGDLQSHSNANFLNIFPQSGDVILSLAIHQID
jgi:hypothetical protein